METSARWLIVCLLLCRRSIVRQRTKDTDVKRYCVSLLEKFGSFEYTRQTMLRLDLEARRAIAELGGNPILEHVLDELKNW